MNKIALVTMATGKYRRYLDSFYNSAVGRFMPDSDVTIFVLSDSSEKLIQRGIKIVNIDWPSMPWPYPTLLRYHAFMANRDLFCDFDYMFYIDVDMKFVSRVDEEILPKECFHGGLTGVIHPGYFKRNMTTDFENNPLSTAYIKNEEFYNSLNSEKIYYAGGFNGGTVESFLEMSKIISENINIDTKNGIIAKWHDESHMNRYFFGKPIKKLPSTYCFPESWVVGGNIIKKIIALDKDHNSVRLKGKFDYELFEKRRLLRENV